MISDNNMDFRLYASHATEMLNNLIANPALRAGSSARYANVSLQCLVTNFGQNQLDLLDACIAQAQSIAMPIYPGARVFPTSDFADWVNPVYWQTYANNFQLLADRRLTGDPRIGIDAENYKTSSEPTLTTLSSNGFTVQQFRAGIQPFLNKMVAVGAIVCVYPQVRATAQADLNQFIVALLDSLGPEGVEVWWEDTFGVSELKRLTPNTDFAMKVAAMRRSEADFERNYGVRGLKHRHVIDDDVIRAWGAPMRSDLNTYGAIRPWIFDLTRKDQSQNGTPGYINGTTIKSVNDAQYVWAFPPLNRGGSTSVGVAAPLVLQPYRGSASSIQNANAIGADAEGMRIQPPPGVTVGEMRANALMSGGKNWMIDFTFQIPRSIGSDVPVISQAQYNSGLWQVYYDNTNNKLVLQIPKPPGSIPPGSNVRYMPFDVLPGVTRDSDIRIQIGRNGNTWLYTAQNGAINRTDVGFDAATGTLLVVGAGQTPATFPTHNTQACCVGLLLKGQLAVWHRLPTDIEITEQIRAGQYPWGRGS